MDFILNGWFIGQSAKIPIIMIIIIINIIIPCIIIHDQSSEISQSSSLESQNCHVRGMIDSFARKCDMIIPAPNTILPLNPG